MTKYTMSSVYHDPWREHHPPSSRIPPSLRVSILWRAYTPAEVWDIQRNYPRDRYFKLHNERKWAVPPKKPPFPFLKLPTEIRLEIYRHVLVRRYALELWPHCLDNSMYRSTQHRRTAFHCYRSTNRSLRLLRVNKLIHTEASQVFYSENVFRFSGINGWMVLDAFLHTIGAFHAQFLSKIMVHVPFPGTESLAIPKWTNLTFRERICTDAYQRMHMRCFLTRYGLRVPTVDWDYDLSIERSVEKLGGYPGANLSVFKLVLPPTYYIKHEDEAGMLVPHAWYWRRLETLVTTVNEKRAKEGKRGMQVGFVFLRHTDRVATEPLRNNMVSDLWYVRYRGQCKTLMDRIRQTEWVKSVEYGVHSMNGRYEVVGKEACKKLAGPLSVRLEEIGEEEDLGDAAEQE